MSDVSPYKPAVLVIDDEVQIRRLLRVTLEANGYRVWEASTGNDGIVEAAQRRPDVVVLDLGLPDLTVSPSSNVYGNGAASRSSSLPCGRQTMRRLKLLMPAPTTT